MAGNLDENTNWDDFPVCPKCGYRFTDGIYEYIYEYPEDEAFQKECPECESNLTIQKQVMVRFETKLITQGNSQ